jgi:hypothetical protein
MQQHWQGFTHSAQSDFASVFSAGLKGEFNSIGDAFQSLTERMLDSFINMVADIAAQNLAQYIFGIAATGSAPATAGLLSGVGGWLGGLVSGCKDVSSPTGGAWQAGGLGGGAGGIAGSLTTSLGIGAAKDYIMSTAAYKAIAEQFGSQVAEQIGTQLVGGQIGAQFGTTAAEQFGAGIIEQYMAQLGSQAATTASTEVAASAAAETGAGVAASGSGAGLSTAMPIVGAIVALGFLTKMISDNSSFSLTGNLTNNAISPQDIAATGVGAQLQERSQIVEANMASLSTVLSNFGQISVDAASGVMMLGDSIQAEATAGGDTGDAGGLVEKMQYMMLTFDAAGQQWTNNTKLFTEMTEKMQKIAPVTADAIGSTADYIATMYGVPSAADELAIAFIEMQTGVYGLAGAASGASDTIGSAYAAMNALGGQVGVPLGGQYPGYIYDAGSGSLVAVDDANSYGVAATASQSILSDWNSQWTEGGGMASGGVVNRLLVPRGDDGFAALKYGDGIIDTDTMTILSRTIRSWSNSSKMSDSIAALNEEIIQLRAEQQAAGYAMANNTKKMNDILAKWDRQGMPPEAIL